MENQANTEDIFDIAIDAKAKSLISDIALWAKIVAIVGFVSYGISLIVAFLGKNSMGQNDLGVVSRTSQIVGTLIVVIIGVIINLFLYRFSIEAKNGVEGVNQGQLETGFNNLRTYFKILGILTIIIISIMALALLFGGLAAMLNSNK